MDMKPDPQLSAEEQSRIEELSIDELEFIDSKLLENCSDHWRKVAELVGMTMMDNRTTIKNIPDIFLAARVYELINDGLLQSRGFLGHMRYCEVRITVGD